MDVRTINDLLRRGEIRHEEMWPHLVDLARQPAQFNYEFGLEKLPEEPGLIIIRGPRQYGKSTWLEMNLKNSVEAFGAGSAYYLNGDDISSEEELSRNLNELGSSFPKDAGIRRIFIDEVTAVADWQKAFKRVWDKGGLRDVLVITTGSKALDLRRGSEKLPGRKGKLSKNEYIFLPVSYRNFKGVSRSKFGDKTWIAYLITGGSPVGCNELLVNDRLPDYFIQLIRDWVQGEIVSSGRSRQSLTDLFHIIFRLGGQPVGFAKLAREAGLANNTVAAGYVEQLADLLSIIPSWQWDQNKKTLQIRKPCKFHFINLAAAVAFHPSAARGVAEFEGLDEGTQGMFIEWLVAQEIWRRSVISGADNPEAIGFWKSAEHDIDFVTPERKFIEVKRGRAGPLDFSWFEKAFPKDRLTVVCSTPFETEKIKGITIEDFLMSTPTNLQYAD